MRTRQHTSLLRRALLLAPLSLILIPAPANASDATHLRSRPSFLGDGQSRALFSYRQPEDELADQTPATPPTAGREGVATLEELNAIPRYGTAGREWIRAGVTFADDFGASVDVNAFGEWSRFLIDDLELGVQLGVWYHNQPGDNALSLNPNLIVRWHFVNRDTWSLYLMGGIGALIATDNVPDGGTGLNFTPQAGLGFTHRLDAESGIRLDVGLRWHHISNARINGDVRNPSRDALAFYAGVAIPL